MTAWKFVCCLLTKATQNFLLTQSVTVLRQEFKEVSCEGDENKGTIICFYLVFVFLRQMKGTVILRGLVCRGKLLLVFICNSRHFCRGIDSSRFPEALTVI